MTVRVLCVHQRQGQKRATVLGPGRQSREPVEPHIALDDFHHGSRPAVRQPDAQCLPDDTSRSPDCAERRRQLLANKLRQALYEGIRTVAEGELCAPSGPEQVHGQGQVGPSHPPQQQGRSPTGNNAPVDLSRLEMRIDLDVDLAQVAVRSKAIEKGPQVGENHLPPRRGSCPPQLQTQR